MGETISQLPVASSVSPTDFIPATQSYTGSGTGITRGVSAGQVASLAQTEPWSQKPLSTAVFAQTTATITPPAPVSGLTLNDLLALRCVNFADFYSTSGNDCTSALQGFLIYAYLIASGMQSYAYLDDQNQRQGVIAFVPRGVYAISDTIVIPENVVLHCEGQILRGAYAGNLQNNLYLPAIVCTPRAHISKLMVNCNPDGTHIGSGLYCGKNWTIATMAVGAQGTGYSVGETLTLACPSTNPYYGATCTVKTVSSGKVTAVTFVSGGAYSLSPALQTSTWTAANGFSVFDANGHFTTTASGAGTGCTISATAWASDFPASAQTYDPTNYLIADTLLGDIRVSNAGSATSSTYGTMFGVGITGLNYEINHIEVSSGGGYGIWFYQCSDVRANTLNAVSCATGIEIYGCSSVHCPNIVLDSNTYAGLDISYSSGSVLRGYAFWNDGLDGQGMGTPNTSGYCLNIGGNGANSGIDLQFTLTNAGAATAQPAVHLANAKAISMDLHAGNWQYANGSAATKTINALVNFGTGVDASCLVTGHVDSITGPIYTGTAPVCGMRIWDSVANGFCGPGGVYDLVGSASPTSSTAVNKANTGTLYRQTTAGQLWINQGTAASPSWHMYA